MNLDRWIALLFLLVCMVYGLAAVNYPLLPFERNMSFLPNTLPMALSAFGIIVALYILLTAKSRVNGEATLLSMQDVKQLKIGQAVGLICAMIGYALLLRPIGFIPATTLFIAITSTLLGERKFHCLIPIALIAAFSIWYLVQQTLGIYLRPWPQFISGN